MIDARIVGDRELIQRLDSMPDRVRSALHNKVLWLALKLQQHVVRDKLNGQVLKVKTGRLRRSINNRVDESAQGVFGAVGTNVEYAAVHEFGFTGIVSVREHLRRTINGNMANVRGHSRHVDVKAKSFLMSALDDMKGEIRDGIKNAALGAVKKK